MSPSRRERAARQLARCLAYLAAATLLAAALLADPTDWLAACGSACAALLGRYAGRPLQRPAMEVGIDRTGRPVLRRVGTPEASLEPEVRCLFAATWLVTLRHGAVRIPIWPDSVSGNTFRRLWVHIRWGAPRGPAGRGDVLAPGRPE